MISFHTIENKKQIASKSIGEPALANCVLAGALYKYPLPELVKIFVENECGLLYGLIL